jgi:hypothetical protein
VPLKLVHGRMAVGWLQVDAQKRGVVPLRFVQVGAQAARRDACVVRRAISTHAAYVVDSLPPTQAASSVSLTRGALETAAARGRWKRWAVEVEAAMQCRPPRAPSPALAPRSTAAWARERRPREAAA